MLGPTSGQVPYTGQYRALLIGDLTPLWYNWSFSQGAPPDAVTTSYQTNSPATNFTWTLWNDGIAVPTPDGITCIGSASVTVGFAAVPPYATHPLSLTGALTICSNPENNSSPCTMTAEDGLTLDVEAEGPLNGTAPLTVDFEGQVSGGYPPYNISADGLNVTTDGSISGSVEYLQGEDDLSVTATDSYPGTFHYSVACWFDVMATDPPFFADNASDQPAGGSPPLDSELSVGLYGGHDDLWVCWPGEASWAGDDPQCNPMETPGTYSDDITFPSPGAQVVTARMGSAPGGWDQAAFFNAVDGLTASASATPTQGHAPLNVTFASAVSGGIPDYSYSWNFEDGSAPSALPDPSHEFVVPGNYDVALTVIDGVGIVYHSNVTIQVEPAEFLATFQLSGSSDLPAGESWCVDLISAECTTGRNLAFSLENGNYSYVVEPVANFTVTPVANTLSINGRNPPPILVTFSYATFSVSFSEAGLPAGSNWSVTLIGTSSEFIVGGLPAGALMSLTNWSGGRSTVEFRASNGTYTYSASAAGFGGSPGNVTVNGEPGAPVPVQFAVLSHPSSTPSFSPVELGLVGLVVTGLVIAAIWTGLRHRKGG